MSLEWTKVALNKVLTRQKNEITIQELDIYDRVTIRMNGGGICLRDRLLGSEIGTKNQFLVRKGQLLLSKIDARNGAFGIVPDECDGAIITGNFWAFDIDHKRLDSRFFDYLTRTRLFIDFCIRGSEGTTNRLYLQEPLFLAQLIPLPPLAEQCRIVTRIEELATKIEEARGLRHEAAEQIEGIMSAEEMQIWPAESLHKSPSLEEVTSYLSRGRQSEQGESYHYLIKTQHVQMGHYIRTPLTLASHVASKVSPEATARLGDTLIACSAAGCLGRVAFYTDTERVASTDTHVAIARPNPQTIIPEYLYAYLKGAQGQLQLRSRERGDWTREKVGFRLTELNVADMRRIPVPTPPIEEQRRIVAYLGSLQAKIGALKTLQAETQIELEAMLPAMLDKAFKGEL